VDGYVIKPFHLGALLSQVERAVQRHQRQFTQAVRALRSFSYVVANSDRANASQIEHLLVTHGLHNVTLTDSGQKALRHGQERGMDFLVYDCNIRDPYWKELKPELDAWEPPRPQLVVTSAVPLQQEFEDVLEARQGAFYVGPVKAKPFLLMLHKAHETGGERP